MRVRRALVFRILLAAFGAAALTRVFGGAPIDAKDPMYRGYPLGYYLTKDLKLFAAVEESPRKELTDALTALGEEAAPAIRRRLRARDKPLQILQNQLAALDIPFPVHANRFTEAWEARKTGLRAAYYMGSRAASLIPELVRLLNRPDDSREAALVLGEIGAAAAPALARALSAPSEVARRNAALGISRIRGAFEPEEILERLLQANESGQVADLATWTRAKSRVEREIARRSLE